jgi:hypothetical protein
MQLVAPAVTDPSHFVLLIDDIFNGEPNQISVRDTLKNMLH